MVVLVYDDVSVSILVHVCVPKTEESACNVIMPGIVEPEGAPNVNISVQPLGKPVEIILTEAMATDPVFVMVMGIMLSPFCSCPQFIEVSFVHVWPLIVKVALTGFVVAVGDGAIAVCGIEYWAESAA